MKIRVPYVKVTAVQGREVHDICFVDTADSKHATELCRTEGMKVLSSESKTYQFELDYMDATSEVVFVDTCAAADCDVAWSDTETKFVPLKGGE